MSLTALEMTTVHNVLVQNKFPSKNIELDGLIFISSFVPEPIPFDISGIIDFFKPAIVVKDLNSVEIDIELLPAPLFFTFLSEYISFYSTTLNRLTELIPEYVDTFESENLWAVLKVTSPEHVFSLKNKQLNLFHQAWIVYNTRKDTKSNYSLINTLFEALKPWLNTELYGKIKEREDATRENWLFDDEERDAELQRQADTILKKKREKEKPVAQEDLDIIEIEEQKNG